MRSIRFPSLLHDLHLLSKFHGATTKQRLSEGLFYSPDGSPPEMTVDKQHSEHAPLSPATSPQPSPLNMTPPWTPNESTRNYYLKKYTTPVASAVSTVCATLAVVSRPSAWTTQSSVNANKHLSRCRRRLKISRLACKREWAVSLIAF